MESKKIGIIGSGDFGRAFAQKALKANYDVVIGSRDPSHRHIEMIDKSLADVNVLDILNCISHSDLIICAIRTKHYSSLSIFKEQLKGKVLMDVSNLAEDKEKSNAEVLLEHTDARIVKGFSVLSSWALQSDSFGASKSVYICSDDTEAKLAVMQLARDIGFTPVDRGTLYSARDIEAEASTVFTDWLRPTIFSWFMFLIFTLWTIARMFMRDTIDWSVYPLTALNPAVCTTAIFLLACCYLPGEFAAFLQLYYGNKYTRFPDWLDRWLKSRKQLGIWAFFFATVHMIMSLLVLSSWNLSRFHTVKKTTVYDISPNLTIKVAKEFKFYEHGEVMLLFGLITYMAMAVLAITTIPSISERLKWREYVYLQSYLGYFSLAAGVVHILIYSFPRWMISTNPFKLVRSFKFIASLLPILVLFLKLILLLPCLYVPLRRIREGIEVKVPWKKTDVKGEQCINLTAVTAM